MIYYMGEVMINPSEALELLDRSGIVLIKWSTDPGISATYISDNISQFGYTPADFYDGELKDYWKFVYEEDRDWVRSDLYNVRQKVVEESGNSYEVSYRVRCKNGEIRWVQETLLYDKVDGEVNERGFLRDITDSTNTLFHMRESSEKYNFLSENVDEMICVIDRFDVVLSANSRFTEISGLKKGERVTGLLNQGYGTMYELTAGTVNDMEVELHTPQGVMTVSLYATRLSTGNLYIVAKDVTEMMKYREHLDFVHERDLASGLLNQNILESFVSFSGDEIGYRVVMAKVIDYKNEIQKRGYAFAEVLSKRVASVIRSEFSMYDDSIYRSFEDEYVIFTRSPINNVHIHNVNRALAPDILLEWGISRRGTNLRELLIDAGRNIKEMNEEMPVGSIFGFKKG